jgi:hypothetical protein
MVHYHPLLPQLTQITYNPSDAADFDKISSQFQLSTALKSLRMSPRSRSPGNFSPAFIRSFKALNLEEFHSRSWHRIEDDEVWQRAFPAVQKLVEMLKDVKSLKKLSLSLYHVNKNSKRAEEWIRFKEDVRKMCTKKNIEVVPFDDRYRTAFHELAWMD